MRAQPDGEEAGQSKVLHTQVVQQQDAEAQRDVILDALGEKNIDHKLNFRYERKSIDYADAYLCQDISDPIVAAVFVRAKKQYRSHRGIPPSEYTGQVNKPWSKKRPKL